MKPAISVAILLVLLPACPGGEEEPRDVVEGFLKSLNTGDWNGVTSRLGKEALALIPEKEEERIFFKHRVLQMARGRLRYETLDESRTEDGQARVPTKLSMWFESMSLTRPVVRTVTFGLVREDGVWKLLPAVTLPSGRVIENPLIILTVAGAKPMAPRRSTPGSDRPAAGD